MQMSMLLLAVVFAATVVLAFDKQQISKKAFSSKKLISQKYPKRFERSLHENRIDDDELLKDKFPMPVFYGHPQIQFSNDARPESIKSRSQYYPNDNVLVLNRL
ncbi:unnamed protein product [Anisakis simplex]|uniref:Uncharacterized protein n=1 Tax=Anisakis simplex TaxID=6269 RepID=A0A0M3IYM6_ANISI|nr:unnamed protein product [Anisakis simplex]